MEDEFDALMGRLEGGISLAEARALRRLAAGVGHGSIVEVGSYRGKSAIALARGVRDAARVPPVSVYCIEPHRPFTGYYGGEFGAADRARFYQAMLDSGTSEDVALVGLSSDEVAGSWREPVALAFIDGDHHYDGVRRDFGCWDPHLVTGGLVAFDDALDPACGPAALIREILAEGRYREVERVGKIVVLQKLRPDAAIVPARRLRVLVACDDVVLAGGLLRFERAGAALRRLGHEVAWLRLGEPAPARRPTALPVLDLAAAQAGTWDAVMVPGSGFPEAIIEGLARLRSPRFGLRVQHILNDQTFFDRFLHVNRCFAPDLVVFNNRDWPAGSFTAFGARQFHVLEGAVDSVRFRPASYRTHPLHAGRWIVGGQAAKNPAPLVEALERLPADVTLRLFGPDHAGLAAARPDLVAAGRLELAGTLDEDALAAFYRDVDCVAMTETHAGWANLAAEAMASGVPLVCTTHGTRAFARDGETALVVAPEAGALAAAIDRLHGDAELARALAEAGRETIAARDWERYARDLVRLLQPDPAEHYLHQPGLGLFGKWPPADRLAGLAPLLARAQGARIIDFGCAEGVVAREFLRHGAASVHGFERDPVRVARAAAVCATAGDAVFRQADLSDPDGWRRAHADLVLPRYDIVLYLGIHHHVAAATRGALLDTAIALSGQCLAIRTPPSFAAADAIAERCARAGLSPLATAAAATESSNLGELMLFERAPDRGA
jgi:glycosyltransferase involved in cell wall biosynthesis/predicted O-methyltransferase YrrM